MSENLSFPQQAALEAGRQLLSAAIQTWLEDRKKTKQDIQDEHHILARYLNSKYESVATTKTVFLTQTPCLVEAFYEPLDLIYQDYRKGLAVERVIRSANLNDIAHLSRALLVSGTAGAGKTTLLKKLFLDAASTGSHLPIFLELRHSSRSSKKLLELIESEFEAFMHDEIEGFGARLLLTGNVLLILDGFDEIERQYRSTILNQLIAIMERFPDNLYILSSRPDPQLESVNPFLVVRPAPLRFSQSVSLVERLPAASESKERFMHYLRQKPDKQFESFVANPLLLCIMFLTFLDAGTIEYKRSAFYHDAFQAMYNRHDARKYNFTRQFISKLDRLSLEQVCARLAIQTFLAVKRSFSHAELTAFVRKASGNLQQPVPPDDLIDDLLQTVCLLVKDGTLLTYSHRSFEEYFAALFIHGVEPERKLDLVKRVTSRSIRDNVCVQVLHELEPLLVEKKIVLPAINRIVDQARDPDEMFAHMFYWVRSEQLGFGGWKNQGMKARLGNYRDYLGYLMRELDILFPGQPLLISEKEHRLDSDIDELNKLTLTDSGSLRSAGRLVEVFAGAGPAVRLAAELVVGLTQSQVRWLSEVRRQAESRARRDDKFIDNLLATNEAHA